MAAIQQAITRRHLRLQPCATETTQVEALAADSSRGRRRSDRVVGIDVVGDSHHITIATSSKSWDEASLADARHATTPLEDLID
jgi:hypothetical protein